MKRIVTVFFLALLLLTLQPQAAISQGEPLYLDMPLNTVAGETIRLSDYRGKIVVVNYWATWCPPCLDEIPELAQFQRELASQGVQVIGIDFMERPNRERLSRFIKEKGINYPIVFGKSSEMLKLAKTMGGVFGLPVTKFLNREGKIVKSHVGGITLHELKRVVAPYLAKP
jgi:thiol-disulfide isomerase/thioredoxin